MRTVGALQRREFFTLGRARNIMRHVITTTALVSGLLVALSAVPVGAAAQQTTRPTYDGRWWLSVSPSERYGWVAGYLDCYIFEYTGTVGFSIRSTQAIVDSITLFYNADSALVSYDLPNALVRFRDRPSDTAPTGGETHFELQEVHPKSWTELTT